MYLAFDTRQLRDTCESSELARAKWGPDAAHELRVRISDILSARTYADLLAGSPKMIGQGLQECLTFRLSPELCLIVAPNLVDKSTVSNGRVVWSRVGRVKILRLEVCDD